MITKIKLVKLSLIGFRKDYIVDFKDGLNYITGPTSTGKSSIVEMINYAFGSKNHKDYIEIRENCTEVALEFFIGEELIKIVRPLFSFDRPAKIYRWDVLNQDFPKFFELKEIDIPSNENSLSAFLLKELGLDNIKAANQAFSFRDLFKYAYLKQTEIDNENIQNEKYSDKSLKRKPTFEIMFNIYDEILADLKANLKLKKEQIVELIKKKNSIYEFLKNLELIDLEAFIKQKTELMRILDKKKQILYGIKSKGKTDDSMSFKLEKEINNYKNELSHLDLKIKEQKEYIDKL
ncbi:AAA family ATPase, partial [Paenibacillus allorhizoplanae]|uniref:AAA family ATPase n=1 Tax=Paenibacillus allorhizoplanae TaxID=2905648 RepID=UPI001F1809B0